MEEDKTLTKAPVTDGFSSQKTSPYELLMRQSRKMGGVATRTFDVTKEFLKQDVSTLHPDRILFGRRGDMMNAMSPGASAGESNTAPKRSNDNSPEKDVSPDGGPGSVKAKTSQGIRESDERDSHTLDPRDGLRRIVRKSHQLLASAQTVILPVNLFPDSVTVDRTKVTITKRTFFWSSSVISIRIEDVLNVACSTGPIFGSLTISSRVMNSTDHYEIDYFWRKDALYLKQLIQGYVIAQHNQIETSHLNRRELIQTLLDLGSDSDY